MTKDAPTIFVRFERGKLSPDMATDAELLDAYPQRTLFALKYRSQRSNKHLNYYWLKLQRAVEATGRWPNKEQLHKTLMIECGHFTPVVMLDGSVRLEAESASFNAMKQKDFTEYTRAADALLAEHTGIDLKALMSEGEPA